MSGTTAPTMGQQGGRMTALTTTTETTPLLQPGNNATAEPTWRRGEEEDDDDDEMENPDRPKGFKFAVAYSCILLGDFFVGYDTSCVTTLTPVISDEFHAIGDVGWYGIAYILALASTVLAFGQLYTLLPVKPVFLLSFVVFTAGSVTCAIAPSSLIFIVGRAVAGLGGAGIFSGASIVIANVLPLHNRHIYQGISGGVECVSLAFGPAISGAVAHYYSWRMAFLIIAPAALVNILAVWALVPSLPRPAPAGVPTTLTKAAAAPSWGQLDILGMVFFVPAAISLVLALQWGGITHAWDDRPVTALLATAGACLVAFAASQALKGDRAMLPPGLLRRRCVLLGAAASFFTSASLYVFGFYLPVYFQAVRGADTLASGVMYLPSAASLAVAVTAAGRLAAGRPARGCCGCCYMPAMVLLGTVLMSAGAALMTGLGGDTPPLEWAAYQVVFGLGAGVAFQQPYTAVQAALGGGDDDERVPAAMVVLGFVQEVGGVAALAVAQNVFVGRLVMRLEGLGAGLDAGSVLAQGTLSLIGSVPEHLRGAVYVAYVRTVREVFWIGLVCACLTICALGIEWRSVRREKRREAGGVYRSSGGDIEGQETARGVAE